MKILLTIDEQHEPRLLAAYIAERFGDTPRELDLLQVIPSTAADPGNGLSGDLTSERARRRADSRLSGIAAVLRKRSGVTRVETHVEVGELPQAIADTARRCASTLVLHEARGCGRLARWREAALAAELLRLAPCAVEFVKPLAAAPRSLFNVLVAVTDDQLEHYPWATLAALPWPPGTRLQLLGMLAPAAADLPLEMNAFRLIEALSCSRAAQSRAGARLHDASVALRAALGDTVEIDYATVDGTAAEVVARQAQHHRASLLVTRPEGARPTHPARARRAPLLGGDTA
ncbi:MAG: universal stress protein, partial [Gammaproteobacteria bacterium]